MYRTACKVDAPYLYLMGEVPGTKRAKIRDLHRVLRSVGQETDTLRKLIPVDKWESIVVRTIGEMTRQSVQDTTYAMERLGMIRRVPRKGVYIVNREVPLAPDEQHSQSGLSEAAT